MKSKKGAISVEAIVILLLVLVTAALILAGLGYRFKWFGTESERATQGALSNICGTLGKGGACSDTAPAGGYTQQDKPAGGWTDCPKECWVKLSSRST